MSECNACQEGILEHQETVKCAGPCGKSFHLSCAETNEYRNTRGVLKDVTGFGHEKGLSCSRFEGILNSSNQILTEDLLNQALDSFKQDFIKKFNIRPTFENSKKTESGTSKHNNYISDLKEISRKPVAQNQEMDLSDVKNGLHELRIREYDTHISGIMKELKEQPINNYFLQTEDILSVISDLNEISRKPVAKKREIEFSYLKKDLSDLRIQEPDTHTSDIMKELKELRIQNDRLRNENVSLVSQMKALEIKFNDGTKMFDECKKLIFNLSRNMDEHNKLVEKLKDEVKQVRTQNEALGDENIGILRQFNVLEIKITNFERLIKNFTEKNVASSGAVATRRFEGVTIKEAASALQRQDNRMVVMAGATQKHQCFAVEAMGNKPVTGLAGIGPVYGERLNQRGYYKASQVYERFLALNRNPSLFQSWLSSVCGAKSRWATLCYQCLYSWDIDFNSGRSHRRLQ